MKSLSIGLSIAIISIIFDQWSKYYVFAMLDELPYPQIEILPFFNFVKVYNTGVSFGMFSDVANGRLILSILAITITIWLCIWLYRVTEKYMIIALGLIIGGAVGNILDRVRVGAVADFIDIHVAGYHWPAFNIADSSIFIGVAIVLFDSFLTKDENKGNENE